MSKLDLDVVLDSHEPYRPGQTVRGTVHVRPNETVRCDGLDVKLQWFTHGKGNRATGDAQTLRLFAGEMIAGEEASYPFELVVVDEPIPYAGQLLNVGFRVVATADVPWAFDPEADAVIDVVHDPPPRGLVVSWDETRPDSGASCLGISLMLILLAVPGLYIGFTDEPDALGLGMGPLVIGLIGFFISIRGYLAHRRLGPVDVTLEQKRMGGYRDGGQADQLEINLRPTKSADTSGAKATFVVCEEVKSGSGSNTTTHTHTFIREAVDLSPTDDGGYAGRLALPVDAAPYSFYASSNKLLWQLELEVAIPGTADYEETIQLTAKPRPQ